MHAQVDAESVLSHGEPADSSNTLSGLSSDLALATLYDLIEAMASSTANMAQSTQGGENSSAIFNFNELLVTSSAQVSHLIWHTPAPRVYIA